MSPYKEWLDELFEIAPNAVVSEDPKGELIIHTRIAIDYGSHKDPDTAPIEDCMIYDLVGDDNQEEVACA